MNTTITANHQTTEATSNHTINQTTGTASNHTINQASGTTLNHSNTNTTKNTAKNTVRHAAKTTARKPVSGAVSDIMPMRILGQGQLVSNDDLHSGFNNNDLIVGGSGSGKTGGYVIPNIRQGYGNMIVTDTKSQLCRLLGPQLTRMGYKVSVLDFVSPENSVAYNPLDYIRTFSTGSSADHAAGASSNYASNRSAVTCSSGRSYAGYTSGKPAVNYSQKDVVSLARLIVPGLFDKDPFWEDNARTVITFLIAYTMESSRPELRTMKTVVSAYRQLLSTPKFFENWVSRHPYGFAAKKFDMFKNVMSVDRTWNCIVQYVSTALEPYDFAEMDCIFGSKNKNKFTFEDMLHEKRILFLNISDTDRYADRLANLFYAQAMQQLCGMADKSSKGRLPQPVRFILDDFASNVYIEDFDKLISVIRSRNISVSVILQSLTQLEGMYSRAQANTIITNCDHLLYLGGQDIDTAHYIGYRSNKTEETVLLMPMGKAYLIERGKRGALIDRVQPYAEASKNTLRPRSGADTSKASGNHLAAPIVASTAAADN